MRVAKLQLGNGWVESIFFKEGGNSEGGRLQGDDSRSKGYLDRASLAVVVTQLSFSFH